MSANALRPGISVTAEHYERLTKLHRERGVTYDSMVNEALDLEQRRRGITERVEPTKAWQL